MDVIPDYVWWYRGPWFDEYALDVLDRKRDVMFFLWNTTITPKANSQFNRDHPLISRFLYLLETKDGKPEIVAIRRVTKKPILDVLEVKLGKTRLDLYFEPGEEPYLLLLYRIKN